MRAKPLMLTLLALLLSVAPACALVREPSVPASSEPTPLPHYEAQPLPTDHGVLFSTSGVCAGCHDDLVDEAENDVSIDTDWRPAMMANAARDPYWQASVRAEIIDHPQLTSVIEDKCATCHTPMARFAAVFSGSGTALLDGGFLSPDHPDRAFALDGVSCTLCHQVEEQGLRDPDSFSGGFSIDTERPPGERLVYGPFPPIPGPASVMQGASGYRPVEGPQVTRSELCATCHTLYTPYVDEDGGIAGTFPEQTPYLEWQHSGYQETHVCQDCHMPSAQGSVSIASTGGGPPRSPFAQHRFIGGNAYVLKMLWASGEEFDVTASSDHFARKVKQTLEQLQARTATLRVEGITVAESRLDFDVAVENQAGHKFPTGFPARRAWLHVVVADAEGNVIFESGGFNPDGFIIGNDNDGDAAAYEPHYEVITEGDQVQIYEPILETVSGQVTTGLLRAKGYRKDNRLLPSGFDKTSAAEDIAVYGGAADDEDFDAGGDTVHYRINLSKADAALTLTVELLYQSLSYRWAENLRRYDAPEVARFHSAYDELPNEPIVVAETSVPVGP